MLVRFGQKEVFVKNRMWLLPVRVLATLAADISKELRARERC